MRQYYVYIMTNASRTLYTGMTNDLKRRVWEHKQRRVPGFTSRYNIRRLVYFQETPNSRAITSRPNAIQCHTRMGGKILPFVGGDSAE